jgi:2-desacetyl-2-hydroxyethyl bacteriochlorophyllide A dehydrogenase
MQAAVYNGPKSLDVVDYKLPSLSQDELLIKVNACGICGTDFHIFEGNAPAKIPVIIGHEYAGEIVEIGKNVKGFRIGDHIAINPNIHCGYCQYCKKGKINLCENLKALGVTLNGGIAQYSIVPLSQAYLIPNDFPLSFAAFTEPLSCCIHGIEKADIKLNDSIVIVGTGTIGLIMIQLARLKGASKVIAVDVSDEKLTLSRKFNADYTFNIKKDNPEKTIKDLTSGGADVVIECAGNSSALKTSLNLVKKGGTVVLFGLADNKDFIELYLQSFFHKEASIKSSLLNPFTFQPAVDLLVSGKIRVDLFNINEIKLNNDEIKKLFVEPRDSSVIKYMIIPSN